MWLFDIPFDIKKHDQFCKLRKKWLEYYRPRWNGGDFKMNKKAEKMAYKGLIPPMT